MSSPPFRVKAIYDYSSSHEDDLQFSVGQIITVTDEEDTDWYSGEYIDDLGVKQEGIFPRNFVEKYEPTAPPRPTRTRTKREHDIAPPAASEALQAPPPISPKQAVREPEEEEDVRTIPPARATGASPPGLATGPEAPLPRPAEPVTAGSPPPPFPKDAGASATASPPAPKPAQTQPKPGGPPAVSEKPITSSFKDRIAAFNKPAAPPIAPFKPSGLGSGSSGFIKKPFVAPPPSRNAYVPPPRDVPTAKVYRRDEDPEIKEREAENIESAEKAGLISAESQDGGAEDQPKPTSLKERIALLQKQQMEQAQRHAEAAAKKEKPKKPPKKRIESHGPVEATDEAEHVQPPPLERRDTEETGGKTSMDEPHPPRVPHPQRRKSSKGQATEANDGNEADMSGAGDTTEGQEDLTEKDDSDERSRHVATAAKQDDDEIDEEDEVDEEDEDDVDPEVRRKEELRARMAKMSGGMGMHGMFGSPMMPLPGASPTLPKKKRAPAPERPPSGDSEEAASTGARAPPVPTMMALPGLPHIKRPEENQSPAEDEYTAEPDEVDNEEESITPLRTPYQENAVPALPIREPGAAPPVPGGRPLPPPIPTDTRPPPLPPSAAKSPSAGSESDDELSERNPPDALDTPRGEFPQATRAPPPPPAAVPPPVVPSSPRSPTSKRRSYVGEEALPASPAIGAPPPPSKRNSRPPPPIPGSAPLAPPAQTRPPPPPPPGSLSRSSTYENRVLSPTTPASHDEDEEEEEEEITEYEGDYDTDIASSVPHKDALRSHARESSFEDATPVRSPVSDAPPSFPPPIPAGGAPRAVPPPIPSQPPPDNRRSADVPRAAPPPPPPPKEAPSYGEDDYDPFNYSAPVQGIPVVAGYQQPPPPPLPPARPPEESYPPEPSYQPQERRPPPPAPPSVRAPPRQSLEGQRVAAAGRRSTDVNRPSIESGHVANDIDLAGQSGWWLQPNSLPPQLQGRKDIFFESEESTSSKRGGKTTVTRDIYILFQDYSQTVITVRFDPHDPADVHLEQRHEPPPRSLRQDQLEQSYERFGRAIGEAVASKKDTVVGDGTPQALIYELLRPLKDALLPVGTRAYGALVYSNLANASTSQNDEIRAGDIISIRNAKFQGKHGPMHAKYSMEVGKPDHVAVVAEWDGTKKKVRAWEQGRESKKVKIESFKLDDLRSGEVKIWRVMPRSWVGWEGQN